MKKLFSYGLYVLGFLLVVVFFSGMFDGKKYQAPVLPPALQKVECVPKPANDRHAKNNSLLLNYRLSAIYDICIPIEMMKYRDKLKCSYNDEDRLVCDNTAVITRNFVHDRDKVYASDRVTTIMNKPRSTVKLSFSQTSFEKQSIDRNKHYSSEYNLTRGVITPSKMRLRFPFICEDTYSGGGEASCSGDFAFHDLYIRMEIELLGKEGTKVKMSDQVREVNFWSGFLAELLTTPKKED